MKKQTELPAQWVYKIVIFIMSVNEIYLAHFSAGKIYHVYNKTNNKELLFRSDANRFYFLKQLSLYLSPVMDLYAWSLLSNHFHLLLRIKSKDALISFVDTMPVTERKKAEQAFLLNEDVHILILSMLKRFFTSYAMAFNKAHQRVGNLFYRTFKRVLVIDEDQLCQTVIYIHANAQKHGLVQDFKSYNWSSYNTIINNEPTSLLRDEILRLFRGRDRFIAEHDSHVRYYYSVTGGFEEW